MIHLQGHTSIETAYMVDDYPYGRDRCRIRFWMEKDPKKGFRFCSQTEHPRKKIWNAPKKSTYAKLAGEMYLDEKNHVQWASVTEYSDAKQVLDFVSIFPNCDSTFLRTWASLKALYADKGAKGEVSFTINGEKQPVTEEDIQRYRQEHEEWKAIIQFIQLLKGL